MKIAIIQNFYNPYIIGGAEIIVEDIVNGLAKKDDVIVITTHPKKKTEVEIKSDKVKIYSIFIWNFYHPYPMGKKRFILIKFLWWLLNFWNPFIFLQVWRILRKEKPDVVQVHNLYGLSHAVISAVASLKIPIIKFNHDFYMICKNSSFLKRNGTICKNLCFSCSIWHLWNKIFIGKIKKFVLLSEFAARIFNRYYGTNGVIIHNACPIPKEVVLENQRYKKNRRSEIVKLLFMGRLDKHKGILTLLDTFSKIKSDNVILNVAGVGEYEEIVKKVSRRDKRLKYVGFVGQEDKRKLLLESDIMIFPSEWFEMSPIVIQEAYGYGLPVIATRIGSIPEHIHENETGLLFSYKNSDELCKIIEGLIINREKIESMREVCFSVAIKNSMDRFIEHLSEIQRDVR